MKIPKIKLNFAIKTPSELDELSHEELLKYIKDLQKNIVQEKPPKNSNNSSISPSSEINKPKRNQSLRGKSEKSSGGQKGHKGNYLRQSDNPDERIKVKYVIEECVKCGENIVDELEKLKEKRQVIDLDLSKIKAQITEYQSYSKKCSICGYENHDANFPKFVAPYVSYGKTIMATVSYLSTVHFLSYERIALAMKSFYNISLSEGTIDNMIKKTSELSKTEIAKIKEQLEASDLVGIDETGCKINGQKYWNWTFQNSNSTLIVVDKSRGTKVIEDNFENGFVNACVVHDNYSSYSSLIAKDEQLCLAHKLRDLNYAIECDDTQVMKDLKLLLKESMLDHKEKLFLSQREVLKESYLQTLDSLLEKDDIPKSQTQKQINSFRKARDKIFTFLLYPNVPPDNNGSERAIRNIKVKQKVSGQFKSENGAKYYANIRSIVDTSRKRGLNEFVVLQDVIEGNSIF